MRMNVMVRLHLGLFNMTLRVKLAKCARYHTWRELMETVESVIADLANQVKRRRKDFHITQEELALMAGVSRRLIIELEKGKTTISLDRLLLITRTLGLKLKLV